MTDNSSSDFRVSTLENLTALIHEVETTGGVNGTLLLQNLMIAPLHLQYEFMYNSLNKFFRVLINKSTTALVSLRFQHGEINDITVETSQCISNLLDQSLNPLGRLNHISLTSCNVRDEHVEEISKGMKNNNSLVLFELYKNHISNAGAQYIGQAIAINPSLLSLDLSENDITHSGAEALVKGFMQRQYPCSDDSNDVSRHFYIHPLCKEFELIMNYNEMNDAGAKVFATLLHKQHSALSPFVTLTILDLSCCQVGDEGATAIAESLKICNSSTMGLKELMLSGNRIADTGAISIANALKENKVLLLLDLNFNGIELEGGRAFCETLEAYNDTLIKFTLYANPCANEIYKDTNVTIGLYSKRNPFDTNVHHEAVGEKCMMYCQRVKANKILKFIYMGLDNTNEISIFCRKR